MKNMDNKRYYTAYDSKAKVATEIMSFSHDFNIESVNIKEGDPNSKKWDGKHYVYSRFLAEIIFKPKNPNEEIIDVPSEFDDILKDWDICYPDVTRRAKHDQRQYELADWIWDNVKDENENRAPFNGAYDIYVDDEKVHCRDARTFLTEVKLLPDVPMTLKDARAMYNKGNNKWITIIHEDNIAPGYRFETSEHPVENYY